MKNSILSLAALLLSFVPLSRVQAQNVGHLNYQEIIQLMPEYKTASDEYDIYRTSLEEKLKEIEIEAVNVQKKYESEASKPAPNQFRIKQYATSLESLQQEYQFMQQTIQDSLTARMNELVAPIKTKIEGVVAEIAKARGYSHVFDSSVVFMLYSDPKHDLTQDVKTKLGVKDKPTANPGAGKVLGGTGSQR